MSDNMNEFNKLKRDIQKNIKLIWPVALIFVTILLVMTSYYTVDLDEEAVVIRLGRYYKTTTAGLHFKLPFEIDQIKKVKTTVVFQEEFGFRSRTSTGKRTQYTTRGYEDEALMVTGDLNIANVEWVVQYKVSDPFKYIFHSENPTVNIQDVSESIMRQVVGDKLVSDVLTIGREEIAQKVKVLMQKTLNDYDIGIHIVAVKLQDVNPPQMVRPSFNAVNEAKQEQEKMINEAEEAYNKIIPEAKGKAQKKIAEAEGDSLELINRAQGDTIKFLSMLKEYHLAPKITQERIYLETMEKIFKNSKGITVVDPEIKGLLPIFSKINRGL